MGRLPEKVHQFKNTGQYANILMSNEFVQNIWINLRIFINFYIEQFQFYFSKFFLARFLYGVYCKFVYRSLEWTKMHCDDLVFLAYKTYKSAFWKAAPIANFGPIVMKGG